MGRCRNSVPVYWASVPVRKLASDQACWLDKINFRWPCCQGRSNEGRSLRRLVDVRECHDKHLLGHSLAPANPVIHCSEQLIASTNILALLCFMDEPAHAAEDFLRAGIPQSQVAALSAHRTGTDKSSCFDPKQSKVLPAASSRMSVCNSRSPGPRRPRMSRSSGMSAPASSSASGSEGMRRCMLLYGCADMKTRCSGEALEEANRHLTDGTEPEAEPPRASCQRHLSPASAARPAAATAAHRATAKAEVACAATSPSPQALGDMLQLIRSRKSDSP